MTQDVRWEQRFSNFVKAFAKLSRAVEYVRSNVDEEDIADSSKGEEILNDILKEGLIQRFEYTFELAWNVMKDYAEYQGISNLGGSRDAIREALQLQIIEDGKVWMDMIASRIKTVHTYNESTADEIFYKILNQYQGAFLAFSNNLEEKRSGSQGKLL